MSDWKKDLDPLIKDYLNQLLEEVRRYRNAYTKSKDVSKAQIWVALAILFRKINLLEAKLNDVVKELHKDKNKLSDKLKDL